MFDRFATHRVRVLRCLAATGLVLSASAFGAVATHGTATAQEADEFASASTATIHPGVVIDNPEGQCTANFVFRADGQLFLGQAAHCTGTGSASETDGCTAKSLPLGTEVKIQGASKPGKLAYNSWITMQERGEKDPDLCAFNDFALVRIDPVDEDKVNPSVPQFGGPVGLRTAALPAGQKVYSYQNSSLRGGINALSGKEGINLGESGGGRGHEVATVSPGVPGDSGSGFLDPDGKAVGLLSTLNLTPAPGTNGVTDLNKALDYANSHSGKKYSLVNGTEPFRGGVLPGLPLSGVAGNSGAAPAPPGADDPVAVKPKRTDPAAGAQPAQPAPLGGR